MVLTLREMYRARRVVYRYLNRTPLVYSKALSKLLGFNAYFKLENTNPTRAFKVRGGIYYMHARRDEAVRRGVITASTGNHAQSIAYAGSLYGASVVIVMPHGVSRIKVEAVESLGAEVIFHGSMYEEARLYAEKLAREKGMLYVHGVNEPLLYAGVGTMHLENIEDLPDVEVIVNPIGGGSGASSAVIVAKSVDPAISVIGVQAEGARSFYESWRTGKLTSTGRADTIAEGLATSMAYELPFSILAKRIDDVVLVSDRDMIASMKLLLDYLGQVAEPAGASALAAAAKLKRLLKGKNVIIMVTGGNADPKLVKGVAGMDADEALGALGLTA